MMLTVFNLFTLAMLGLPLLGLWPVCVMRAPGRRGSQNSPVHIEMPRRETMGWDATQWRANFGEELIEFYFRTLIALGIIHAVLALIDPPAGYYTDLGSVVGSFVVNLLWNTLGGYRITEYFGKTAYSRLKDLPADSEAAFLATYEQFNGLPVETIARNLRLAAPFSRVLVALLTLRIRRAA